MFANAKTYAIALWRWFRRRPLFVQLLLIVPVCCGILLTITVGNMGLALMGFAIPIYAFFAGYGGALIALFCGKALIIVAKDEMRKR